MRSLHRRGSLAVLWFDLMFDVQTRKSVANPLPSEVLIDLGLLPACHHHADPERRSRW